MAAPRRVIDPRRRILGDLSDFGRDPDGLQAIRYSHATPEDFQMNKWSIFILLLVVPLYAANAEIYKWVDKHGKVHYGDRPRPEGSEKMQLKENPNPESGATGAGPTDAERREKRRRLLEAFEQERTQKEAAAAKKAAERQELKKKCTVARQELRGMKEAGSLYNYDKSGNRVFLSKDEREKAVADFKRTIDKRCR